MKVFEVKTLNDIVIHKDHFIELFKEDRKIDIMIKGIDTHTKLLLKHDEENKINLNKEIYDTLHEMPQKFCKFEEYIRIIKLW